MKKMNWYFAVGAAALSLLLSSCNEEEPAQETPADNQEEEIKPKDDKPSVNLNNIELEGTSWEIVSLEINGNMGDTDWRTFVASDWTAGNDVTFSETGYVLIYRSDDIQPTFHEPWSWSKADKYLAVGEDNTYQMEGEVEFSKQNGFVFLHWVAELGGGALPTFDLTVKRAVTDFE